MTFDDIVASGRKVLRLESEALSEACDKLGQSFYDAVTLMDSVRGKIVVTGLGKSGHIARKVAATLSSTGTPACFLHPAEALHGDLGTITTNDLLLAFAFGGETTEVLSVCDYSSRLGVPIISITGKLASSLAKASNVVLDGGVSSEACPLNLAPTCSSTVALALGDALAVGLMQSRGFGESDFALVHPGGALGRRLSLVHEHMRPIEEVPKVQPHDKMSEILSKVMANNFGISAVMSSEGALVGAITDGDLRRAMVRLEKNVFSLTASEIMSKSPVSLQQDVLASKAVTIMEKQKVTSIFVLDAEKSLVGLLRMHDLLDAKIV